MNLLLNLMVVVTLHIVQHRDAAAINATLSIGLVHHSLLVRGVTKVILNAVKNTDL